MEIAEFPRTWIKVFCPSFSLKKPPTIQDGILSTLLATFIIGAIYLTIGLTQKTLTQGHFVGNLVLLPLLALAAVVVFSLVARFVCGKLGGKGNFEATCGTVGFFEGACIFVNGILFVLLGFANNAVNSLVRSGVSFTPSFVVLGIFGAVMTALCLIVYLRIVEGISRTEKTDLIKAAVGCGVGAGVLVLILLVVLGVYLDWTLGPQLRMLAGFGLD